MPSTDSKEPSPLSEHTDAKDLLNDLKDENTELNSSESNENKSTKMRDNTEVSDNTKTDNESSNFSDSSNTPPPDDDFQNQRKLEELAGINEIEKKFRSGKY